MIRNSTRWRWLVAMMVVLGVFAAACGSSSSKSDSSTTTTGASGSSKELPAATINGSGSTFVAAYINEAANAFKQVQPNLTVVYPPTNSGGSGKGQTDLQANLVDFAGTDVAPAAADASKYQGGATLLFPTVAGPITLSYNLSGVTKLKLDGETTAKIFLGQITKWNDPAITALNSGVNLPDADIVPIHRSEPSGTTANFATFLKKAAPTIFTGTADKNFVFPGGKSDTGNGGVVNDIKATPNSIGYADYSDAKAAALTFASVKNVDGKFVDASLDGATAAVAGATINADLSYDPLFATGAKAYPITSPTYLLVYKNQTDAAKGNALKSFLGFIYGDGQQIASTIDYAPLSSDLLSKSKAQLSDLVIPTS
jgi:phosphate transport system substrate-binding protein